jgi:hypothetical protein
LIVVWVVLIIAGAVGRSVLTVRGVVPPLPQYVFMTWCLIKHRDIGLLVLVEAPVTGVEVNHMTVNVLVLVMRFALIVLVVLYGCETWYVTPKREHRLRVFENEVPWRIFRPKREEVAGGWRRLHNEELHN